MFHDSDCVAVDNTLMRRDWRLALGLAPDYAGFDSTVLVNFRKRLVAHGMERMIFETVLQRDRERAAQPEFRALYRLRAPIEATISQAVHQCELRRSRFRTAAKRELHAIFAITALNARRLMRHLTSPSDGTRVQVCGAS